MQLFKEMYGDCDEFAILATYWLAKNNYEVYFVKVYFSKEWQGYVNHDICLCKDRDGYWYAIDIYFHGSGRNPIGPFKGITEYCEQVPPHYGDISLARYELYDYTGKLVQTVTK